MNEGTPVSEPHKNRLLIGIISFIVFVLAFVAARYLTSKTISSFSNNAQQSNLSKADLIEQTVKQTKESMGLPYKADQNTTLIDITAEPSAIRYHYVLSGIDTNELNNDYLKNYLRPSICENTDTRAILNQGIGMEYSYTVQESNQQYFVSVAKGDC